MKKLKPNQLEKNEAYLVFVGYHYSPSGFDIGTYRNDVIEFECGIMVEPNDDEIQIFELPIID